LFAPWDAAVTGRRTISAFAERGGYEIARMIQQYGLIEDASRFARKLLTQKLGIIALNVAARRDGEPRTMK
jgi:hypothetical protein